MKKSDEQERNIANRLYNLDKKVYETTGSTLGRVFPSSPSFALEKIIDALKINREYFLKNEMTLIANMIGTIRDEEKAAPLKQEYDELEKDILAYNPTIILPHSIDNNDAVASRRFSSDNHLIICISRQFGTGGHTIGFELAQRLGIAYYDKKLITLAAQKSGLSDEFIANNEQRVRSGFMQNLAASAAYSSGFFSSQYLPLSESIFISEAQVIRDIAAKESAVIVGRCADYILAGRDNTINVFVYAPREVRVNRIMARHNLSEAEALKAISTSDKERGNHYFRYTDQKWGKAQNYDVCINSGLMGIEKTAEMLADMAKIEVRA